MLLTPTFRLEQVARALIEAKADIEAVMNAGGNALMLACQNGHDYVFRELLKAGANLESKNKDGFTALMLSCQNGHLEVSCPTQTATLALALAHPKPQANGQRSFALSRSLAH